MADRAGEDGYLACSIYVEHGACSCSTGVPGNVCPLAEVLVSARHDRGLVRRDDF